MKNKALISFAIIISLWLFSSISYAIDDSITISPPTERDIFRIAIIGDRTGGTPEGLKQLERAIYEINQLNPDFVIHIGDMVQGYTRDQDEWLREMSEFKSYMEKLTIPWYSVAGNHDVFTPIRDPNDRTFEYLYKSNFGPLHYSFDYKNSHFVIMYTDEAMTSRPVISEKQLAWLKSDLQKTDKTNTFVFMHKPIWEYADSNWNEFHETIKSFPVKAVIGGHFHSYSKSINQDGIQYYVVGATGGEFHTFGSDLTGYFHHYSILSVEDDKFNMAVVKLGNVESDDYVLVEDYAKIWKIIELSSSKTGINGWLWQPVDNAVKGELEIYAHNPTEQEMSVDVKLDENSGLWSMSPDIKKLKVPAFSAEKTKVLISSPKAEQSDIVPPQFAFQYNFINSKNQHVPVITKRRALLRDKRDISISDQNIKVDGLMNESSWQNATILYNHTWVYSIYDRPDKSPKVHITINDRYLNFFVEVMDDRYSYFEDNLKYKMIYSDTILLSTMKDGKRQDIVIFPFNKGGTAFIAKDSKLIPSELTPIQGIDYIAKTDKEKGYYYCEGKIPLSLLFGDLSAKTEVPFNFGVIDNDLEAFIYVRSWAYDRDPEYWGILNIDR